MLLAQSGSSLSAIPTSSISATHVPAPGKTTRTRSQLQPCKPQPKMSLEDKESTVQGTCRAITCPPALFVFKVLPEDAMGQSMP